MVGGMASFFVSVDSIDSFHLLDLLDSKPTPSNSLLAIPFVPCRRRWYEPENPIPHHHALYQGVPTATLYGPGSREASTAQVAATGAKVCGVFCGLDRFQ